MADAKHEACQHILTLAPGRSSEWARNATHDAEISCRSLNAWLRAPQRTEQFDRVRESEVRSELVVVQGIAGASGWRHGGTRGCAQVTTTRL
jgi:hypothetical protein